MRTLLTVTLMLTASCGAFQKGYERGYNRSFLESCQQAVLKKGVPEARAKSYCDCALAKVNAGSSIDDAATLCK